MDPLTTLGLAANVITFVDFGLKLVETSRLYYSSQRDTIDLTISSLRHVLKSTENNLNHDSYHSHTTEDTAILALVEEARSAEKDLANLLETVSPESKGARRLWTKVKLQFHQRETEEIKLRLETIRVKLFDAVRSSIRNRRAEERVRLSERARRLDPYSRAAVTALLNQQSEQFRLEVDTDLEFLAAAQGLLDRVEGRVIDPTRTEDSIRRDVEEALLASLSFDVSSDRLSTISGPCAGTFEWIFEQPLDRKWSSLSDFLSGGDDQLYWIEGNEGSGKSTLMKYIFTHNETRSLLRKWAGSTELVTAAFFFWMGGSRLEKSQEGLLRSLLFTILRSRPDLSPFVFPHEWAMIYKRLSMEKNSVTPRIDTWSTRRLREGFELINAQKEYPLKVFLLVDALDEYVGDDLSELVKLFQDGVSNSPNLKILFSSRPMEVFDSFTTERFPSLTLHQLIKPDIEIFVRKHLEDNVKFQEAKQAKPAKGPELVEYILAQSDGVFLWADIMTREVLNLLAESPDLGEILRVLRSDFGSSHLHQLYEHIWNKIPNLHRPQASRILQIVLVSRGIRESYGTVGGDEEPLTVLDLLFAEGDPGQTIRLEIEPWSDGVIEQGCRSIVRSFMTIWPGFITISDKANIPTARILYTHRSVAEFWNGEKGRTLLMSEPPVTSPFNPYLAHMKSAVHHLKVLPNPLPPQPIPLLWKLVTVALISANKIEQGDDIPDGYSQLLNALDDVMTHHHRAIQEREGSYVYRGSPGLPAIRDRGEKSRRLAQQHWSNILPPDPNGATSSRHTMRCQDSFVSLLAQFGLLKELEERLKTHEGKAKLHGKSGRPLLSYALDPHPFARYQLITVDTVKLLLDRGADPNTKFNNTTSWQDALRWQYETLAERRDRNDKGAAENRELARIRLEIMKALVRKVAKVHATTVRLKDPRSVGGERLVDAKRAIKEALEPWLREDGDADSFKNLMQIMEHAQENVHDGFFSSVRLRRHG